VGGGDDEGGGGGTGGGTGGDNGLDGIDPGGGGGGGGGSGAGGGPGGGSGSSGGGLTDLPGGDGAADALAKAKPAFNAPYYRFLAALTRALRDHGLRIWHNGTIRRLPSFTVTPVPGFNGIPGLETDPDPPDISNHSYVEQPVVPGMFQAPPDIAAPLASSLAFVLANPWVDPAQTATFPVAFTFEPALYPGWTNFTPYVVTRQDADGNLENIPGVHTGALALNRNVPPGEITWWVFTRM